MQGLQALITNARQLSVQFTCTGLHRGLCRYWSRPPNLNPMPSDGAHEAWWSTHRGSDWSAGHRFLDVPPTCRGCRGTWSRIDRVLVVPGFSVPNRALIKPASPLHNKKSC